MSQLTVTHPELEDENAKLKKLLAEQMLDAAALRELLSKKWQGPPASAKASRIFGPRWACRNGGPARSSAPTARWSVTAHAGRQTPSFGRNCATSPTNLANERKRFGYRRLFVLLRRDGEPSGINRIYRLYREEGLTARKRRARRRAVGSRAPILVESKPNARWSVDFVHDQLACGRRLRILNIVDDVTRERLAAIPDTSISGRRVARELTALINGAASPA